MTPSPDRHFRQILTALGFRPTTRRNLYVLEAGDNTGMLHLPRSPYSTSQLVHFDPTIAVVSGRLSRIFGPIPVGRLPEPYVQHWYRGAIYIHAQDSTEPWYDLATQDPATWRRAERDLTVRIVPVLREHVSDEGLRDCWLKYDDPYLPPVAQLTYLALLLRDLGPAEALEHTIARLTALVEAGRQKTPGLSLIKPGLAALGMSTRITR